MTQDELEAHRYRFNVQHHKRIISVTVQGPHYTHIWPHVATHTAETREAAMELARQSAEADFVARRLTT